MQQAKPFSTPVFHYAPIQKQIIEQNLNEMLMQEVKFRKHAAELEKIAKQQKEVKKHMEFGTRFWIYG